MKILRNLLVATAMLVTFVSCDNNTALIDALTDTEGAGETTEDGDTKKPGTAILNIVQISDDKADATSVLEAEVKMQKGYETVKAQISFNTETAKKTMKRLYITENVNGEGAHPYVLQLGKDENGKAITVSESSDGAIRLSGSNDKAFTFVFNITPEQLEKGAVEYKFWVTSDRGDFRDTEFKGILGRRRRVAEVGTIKMIFGAETNEAKMKHFTVTPEANPISLEAPTADGRSFTFISLFDGATYPINDGKEFAAFWDFGYFYYVSKGACLQSTNIYEKRYFTDEIQGIIKDYGKNETKFKIFNEGDITFDNITAEQLSEMNISDVLATNIDDLKIGNIVKFVDNYGKKGLIKVTAFTKGNGSNGKITIEVKMEA